MVCIIWVIEVHIVAPTIVHVCFFKLFPAHYTLRECCAQFLCSWSAHGGSDCAVYCIDPHPDEIKENVVDFFRSDVSSPVYLCFIRWHNSYFSRQQPTAFTIHNRCLLKQNVRMTRRRNLPCQWMRNLPKLKVTIFAGFFSLFFCL